MGDSRNEELQSSKEEIQTVNGELESVNRELVHRIEELDTARSDLQSLFEGAQVATVFLDNDLCIKRFTPTATELFRLREGDVGPPVTDITARFRDGNMVEEIRDVLRTLQRKEIIVSRIDATADYLMRILPYRTRQNVIDGVVVAFLDITEMRRAQDALESAKDELELKIAERTAALKDANAQLLNDVETQKQLKRQLELAADSADAGLWAWDYEANRLWVTNKARSLYGFPPDEEIAADRFFNALHPDDLERVTHTVEQAFRSGTVVQIEYRIVMPDKSVKWIGYRLDIPLYTKVLGRRFRCNNNRQTFDRHF